MTHVHDLPRSTEKSTDSPEPAKDEWLSARTHLDCYDVRVSSDRGLAAARISIPTGCFLTARSSVALRKHLLPLVDQMALLRRTGARPVDPAPASAATLGDSDAAALGDLLADHFAHRWVREPAFDPGLVRRAYRDWGFGLPQRSLLIRGVRRDNRIIAMAALRVLSPGTAVVDPIVTAFNFRAQGLATTLLQGALALLPPSIHRVEAAVSIDNEASLRVFQKLGFERYAQRYIYAGRL